MFMSRHFKSPGSLSATFLQKTYCFHKQEKRLRINFSKQPSPLSAHVSWGFGFDLAFKASQNSARDSFFVCVCVSVYEWVCVGFRLILLGLNIQIDICCGNKICLAARHYYSVLNETRDTLCSPPYLVFWGINDGECRNNITIFWTDFVQGSFLQIIWILV